MTRRLYGACALMALCAGLGPAAAHAQPAPATGGLHIQPMQSGPVVAPDVRLGQINDRDATLVGGYAGWLTDHKLFIGGAGYWLANRDDDFKVQYGGALVRWTFRGDRAVGLSTGVLLGLGNATLTRAYGDLFDDPPNPAATTLRGETRVRFGGSTRPTDATLVRVRDDFVVAEPQINAVVRLTPWLSLDAGAGYRFVGASDLLEDQLRGASGSIALRFGGR